MYNQATLTSQQSVPYALGVYSFKGNDLESLKTLATTRSTLTKIKADELKASMVQVEALTQVAEKLARTPWTFQNKHLAYKFLTASLLSIPAVWAFVEPDFTRMVREGGSTTDTIIFAKLHMDRAPFFKEDSRIWKQAPRFWPSQLTTLEPAGDVPYGHVTKVELSDTETKDVYHVRRVENRIPLGKTFVVVGCEDKAIEYTLVFPPLQKSLKAFVLDDYRPAPTSESAKKRFYRKYNIMSNGGGSSDFVVYKLSDFSGKN